MVVVVEAVEVVVVGVVGSVVMRELSPRVESKGVALDGRPTGVIWRVVAISSDDTGAGHTAGLHSARQLVTTARKKTMSEVGNLKASNGASRRCPDGSILTNGPIRLASVGQPSESMNSIELATFLRNTDSIALSFRFGCC